MNTINNCISQVDFTVERVELSEVSKDSVIDWKTMKLSKLNKTTYGLKGTSTFLTELNNDISVGTELLQLQGGEYRKTVVRIPTMKYCDFVKKDTIFIPELVKASNYSTDCPIPAVG